MQDATYDKQASEYAPLRLVRRARNAFIRTNHPVNIPSAADTGTHGHVNGTPGTQADAVVGYRWHVSACRRHAAASCRCRPHNMRRTIHTMQQVARNTQHAPRSSHPHRATSSPPQGRAAACCCFHPERCLHECIASGSGGTSIMATIAAAAMTVSSPCGICAMCPTHRCDIQRFCLCLLRRLV